MNYFIDTFNTFEFELPLYLIDNIFLSAGSDLLEACGNEEPLYSDIYLIKVEGLIFKDNEALYKIICINTDLDYEYQVYINAFMLYKLIQILEIYEVMQEIYSEEFFSYELISTQPKKVLLKKLPNLINLSYEGIDLLSVDITHFSEADEDSFEIDCEAVVCSFLDNSILSNL